MDSRELTEWALYERLEPFDGTRIDANGAQVAMILANAHRGKNAAPVKFEDCVIKYEGQQTTGGGLKAKFMAAMGAMGRKGGKRGADGDRKLASPPDRSH